MIKPLEHEEKILYKDLYKEGFLAYDYGDHLILEVILANILVKVHYFVCCNNIQLIREII